MQLSSHISLCIIRSVFDDTIWMLSLQVCHLDVEFLSGRNVGQSLIKTRIQPTALC